MRIVIVGDGKVGYALTENLSGEENDVVVIDSNKSVLLEVEDEFDVQVVHGNGVSLEVQRAAEVGASNLLIAATSADELNLLCCMIARKLGCPHTIARVRNPIYAADFFLLKDELGLSMMVNPDASCSDEVFRLLQFPSFLQRDTFAKGRAEIVEIELRPGSPLIGNTLSDIDVIARAEVLVCAVSRGGDVYVPDGSFQFEEKDRISVAARSLDLARLVRSLGLSARRIRNVMIIGGGSRIAGYLTPQLIKAGVGVTLIDHSPDKCEQLAQEFSKATVILGDGSNRRVLDAEGIKHMDAVVTLTNIDEENLIISMYADHVGVPKVITKINRTEYREIFADRGIGRVVCPKELCTNDIVRYVRAMRNRTGGEVIALHRIVNGGMEALEFRATSATRHLGMTLAEMELRPGILVACINRSGKVIIPQGSDTINAGDTVIIVTHADRDISDLNEIFADYSGKRAEPVQ